MFLVVRSQVEAAGIETAAIFLFSHYKFLVDNHLGTLIPRVGKVVQHTFSVPDAQRCSVPRK